jgi:hypothetical protein
VALSGAKRVGVNVTLMVHFEPTFSDPGQLLVSLKSAKFAPVIAMLMLVSEVVPLLVSVTFFAVLAALIP